MNLHEEPESCKWPFCPHFERNTCLIHFTCCDEEDWYPCHKCHNDAITLMRQENGKSPVYDTRDYGGERNGLEEKENLEEGRSNVAETSRAPDGIKNAFNDAEMGTTARASGAHNDGSCELAIDDKNLQTENVTGSSPLGNDELEPKLDDKCVQEQEGKEKKNSLTAESSLSKFDGAKEGCLVDETSISNVIFSCEVAQGSRDVQGAQEDGKDNSDKETSVRTSEAQNDHGNDEPAKGDEDLPPENDRNSSSLGNRTEHLVDNTKNKTQTETSSSEDKKGEEKKYSLNAESSLSNVDCVEGGCLADKTSNFNVMSSCEAAADNSQAEGVKGEATTDRIGEEGANAAGGLSDQLRNRKEIHVGKGMQHRKNENNSLVAIKEHTVATARDGSQLKCAACGHIQSKFCGKCEKESCGRKFSSYFCSECKLLIESGGKMKLNPYHCSKCGVCRSNKEENFHCDKCNVCIPLSLKNHKCFDNRGHDPCAICLEEVFSGAVILPCFHMIHKDCAVKFVRAGNEACPFCRNSILQNEDNAEPVVEEAGQHNSAKKSCLSTIKTYVNKGIRKVWPTKILNLPRFCLHENENNPLDQI